MNETQAEAAADGDVVEDGGSGRWCAQLEEVGGRLMSVLRIESYFPPESATSLCAAHPAATADARRLIQSAQLATNKAWVSY